MASKFTKDMEPKPTWRRYAAMAFVRNIVSPLRQWLGLPNLPKTTAQKRGRLGESFAAKHLRKHGYRVLVRNYLCPWGELDLVCRHEKTLVVVEVKTRSADSWGTPAEAVTPKKQRRIIRTTYHYLSELALRPPPPVRFDIVEVFWDGKRPSTCHVLRDAFELPDTDT